MPRYMVQWTWETTWTVEAESEAVALECAGAYGVLRDALDSAGDPSICADEVGPSESHPTPDAVAVDGKLVHPEDGKAEWERLVGIVDAEEAAFDAYCGLSTEER